MFTVDDFAAAEQYRYVNIECYLEKSDIQMKPESIEVSKLAAEFQVTTASSDPAWKDWELSTLAVVNFKKVGAHRL